MSLTASSSSGFADLSTSTNVQRTPLEIRTNQNYFIDQCSYNCQLILQMTQKRDQNGNIPSAVKTSIASTITNTANIISSFATSANLTNLSADNQLGFYFAVYTDLNSASYIQLGSDLNLNNFLTIDASTADADIISYTSDALSQLQNY